MPDIGVEGIVSQREKKPYLKISIDGEFMAQLSMAEARSFATDIFKACAWAEADAMIYKFFDEQGIPTSVVLALMVQFRAFRADLDFEFVKKSLSVPLGEEPPPKGPSNA